MSSPPRSPTLNQVIEHTIRELLAAVHTGMPGEIVSFDAAKQTCEVRPQLPVPRELEDGSVVFENLPVLKNVRVGFQGGGGIRLTFPLKQGDQVAIVFAEAALDLWQARGGIQQPNSLRRFHLADAWVVPALKVWQGGSSSAATLGAESGPQVVFRDSVIELGGDAASPPTEAMLLGTKHTNDLGSLLDQVTTGIGQIAGKLAVAASSLGIAGSVNAAPMIGGAMAAAPFALVVTQLGLIGGDLGTLATNVAQLRAQLAQHTSTILKVK